MGKSAPFRESQIYMTEPDFYVLMYQRSDRFTLPEAWREGVDEVYIYFAKGFQAIIVSKPENLPTRVKRLALRCPVSSWKQFHIPYEWMGKLWRQKSSSLGTPRGFWCYSLQEDDSLALSWQIVPSADSL
jgi:hypothetical protein